MTGSTLSSPVAGMIDLALKPGFAHTANRFTAWWHGQVLDRPPVSLSVLPTRPYRGPISRHESSRGNFRGRWLDVQFTVESAIARLEQHDYPGDALPVFFPNMGPEITATLLGCDLEFSADSTWAVPVVHELSDWKRVIGAPLRFDNPYWQAVERMTALALDMAAGRFLVGITDLHDNYDTMAALRDPQALCLDLIDDRPLIKDVGRDLTRVFRDAFARQWAQVSAAGQGCSTWCSCYHRGPWYLPSCDFWCMVDGQTARELILPDIVSEMDVLEHSLFHLDGPGALRHLDLLLELPQLDAVQWVYGDGQGPAARWVDVYRRIIDAGKSVEVIATDAADAMTVLEALGPHGVWLHIDKPLNTLADAHAFLRDVERASLVRA